MPDEVLTVTRGGEAAADPGEVESLYFAAFHAPPLNETRDAASMFSRLYGEVRGRPDLITVEARHNDAVLVGFAFGHHWRWVEQQSDPWAMQLRERLDEAAAREIEDTFAVYLLAVDPAHRRAGLGRRLLRAVLDASGELRAWLITRDDDTAARALYESEGWRTIGHGPNGQDGRPGLVLAWGSRSIK